MSTAEKHHNPAFLALVNEAKSRIKQMNIDEYQQMAAHGENFLLVDIREESEWAAGHARDAIHMGKGILERDIETKVPDKNATLVLYCGGGYRSALSADALARMGYRNAISLDGGWRAYQAANLPVEK
jgi:rhodanese-related sulfurtransferase